MIDVWEEVKSHEPNYDVSTLLIVKPIETNSDWFFFLLWFPCRLAPFRLFACCWLFGVDLFCDMINPFFFPYIRPNGMNVTNDGKTFVCWITISAITLARYRHLVVSYGKAKCIKRQFSPCDLLNAVRRHEFTLSWTPSFKGYKSWQKLKRKRSKVEEESENIIKRNIRWITNDSFSHLYMYY